MSTVTTLTIAEAHAALMSALHDLGVQKARWEAEETDSAADALAVALRVADVRVREFVDAMADGLFATNADLEAWRHERRGQPSGLLRYARVRPRPLTERYRLALAEIERLRGRVRRLKGEVTKWCGLNRARRLAAVEDKL